MPSLLQYNQDNPFETLKDIGRLMHMHASVLTQLLDGTVIAIPENIEGARNVMIVINQLDHIARTAFRAIQQHDANKREASKLLADYATFNQQCRKELVTIEHWLDKSTMPA